MSSDLFLQAYLQLQIVNQLGRHTQAGSNHYIHLCYSYVRVRLHYLKSKETSSLPVVCWLVQQIIDDPVFFRLSSFPTVRVQLYVCRVRSAREIKETAKIRPPRWRIILLQFYYKRTNLSPGASRHTEGATITFSSGGTPPPPLCTHV